MTPMDATGNGAGRAQSGQGVDERKGSDANAYIDGLVDDVTGYAHAQKRYLMMHAA